MEIDIIEVVSRKSLRLIVIRSGHRAPELIAESAMPVT